MHLFGLNRRRSETLLLLTGQLILIAYIFQVAALDHWQANPATDVIGITGSSAHASVHLNHCHGGPSTCAEAGGGFAQFSADQAIRLPQSAPSLALEADSSVQSPEEAVLAAIEEPPQAAA